jgi:hypothetical protein
LEIVLNNIIASSGLIDFTISDASFIGNPGVKIARNDIDKGSEE